MWWILFLLFTECMGNFWLYPGQSGYTVINNDDTYTEVVINEPTRKIALVATDNYYIYYNQFGSYRCVKSICGVTKDNYDTMQECGLLQRCNGNTCKHGYTTLTYNSEGYPISGYRLLNGKREQLKGFVIRNFTSDDAYSRILYLLGYLSELDK